MLSAMLSKSSTYLTKSIMWDSVVAWALFITVIVFTSFAMARPHSESTANFIPGATVLAVLFVGVALSCAIALRPAVEATVASRLMS